MGGSASIMERREVAFVDILPPLKNYIEAAHNIAKSKGFWSTTSGSPEEKTVKIALVITELTEAIESLRKDEGAGRLTEELSDAIIRIFDIAGAYNLDLTDSIAQKMERNLRRPLKHGKVF